MTIGFDDKGGNFDFFGVKKAKVKSLSKGKISPFFHKNKFSPIHQSYWGEKHMNVPLWMQRNTDNKRNLGGKKQKMLSQEERREMVARLEEKIAREKAEKEAAKNAAKGKGKGKNKEPKLTPEEKKAKKLEEKEKAVKEKTAALIEIYKAKRGGKAKGVKGFMQRFIESKKAAETRAAQEAAMKKLKVPKAKYLKQIAELEKKAIITVEKGKFKYHPEAIYPRAKAIAAGAPQAMRAAYGKEERAATQKVRRLVRGGLGAVFGPEILQTKFGPAIKGRPRGPSGKYMIEGKPVFEEEYQKYAAEQRAKNRITPSMQQQAPLLPEAIEQLGMEQEQAMAPAQQLQPAVGTTGSPLTPGEIAALKMMQMPQKGYTSEEIKMAQEIAQKQDQILLAPNFSKGELKATGGSLLSTTGPQILEADNIFKGGLRTLNRGSPASIGEVKIGERPQAAPNSDVYLDIDLGTGKPILKKRTSEAWMDGRAL